jgi:hypothetical protein
VARVRGRGGTVITAAGTDLAGPRISFEAR